MKLAAVLTLGLITIFHVTGLVLSSARDGFPSANDLIIPVWYAFALVGTLIVVRGKANRVAWFCLAIGFAWSLDTLFYGVYFYGTANPGTIAQPDVWAAIVDPLWVFSIFGIATFIPLYFPDGELPSPRWRLLPWVIAIAMAVQYPLLVFTESTTGSYGRPVMPNPLVDSSPGIWLSGLEIDLVLLSGLLFLPVFAGVAASVTALVFRYRRSVGVERQQLRWLATAGSATIIGFIISIFLVEYLGDWVGLLGGAFIGLIPISIGIAIFRYRLYDVDRVISKTIGYALLVGLLSGLYAIVAVGIPFLLPATLDSPMLVAVATLAVAALFNPLRKRIQSWVDRRFNRARYNARQEMDEFTLRLRGAHNLEEIESDMIELVTTTMRPSQVGVWISGS